MIITKKDGLLIVEDHGGLTEKRNTGSFVQFSLIPTLCKKTGSLTIDRLVLHTLKPNIIEGVQQLSKTACIKNIIYAPVKRSKTDYSVLFTQLEQIAPVSAIPVTTKKGALKEAPLIIG